MSTLARFAGLLLLGVFPRPSCGSAPTGDLRDLPAPSASVLTIAAGIGFCESLDVCEKECAAGSSDRCRRLGVSYEFGHGVEADGAHATALYEKACAMKNADGCMSAARMHEFHHGVPQDYVKAAAFNRTACDLGAAAGCANLAILTEAGHGVEKDLTKAAALFTQACSAGSKFACGRAKLLHPATDAR